MGTLLVSCVVCHREVETESVGSAVCSCGSRCFAWTDGLVGIAQKVAAGYAHAATTAGIHLDRRMVGPG